MGAQNTGGGLMFWMVAIKDCFLLKFFTWFAFVELFFQTIFPPRMKSLKDDTILITGSASGIGRRICMELAPTGAKLILWDINKWDNDALAKELRSMGVNVRAYNVDVSDRHKVRTAAEQVKADVGDVTMIINNAGIMPCHNFLSHNPKEIVRAFEVNTLSQIWIVREFLPGMIDRKSGHIACICSSAGLIGARNLSVYSATKFAVNGFMESLRDEIENHPDSPDIKFTTVYPSPCDTSFAKNVVHTRFPWVVPALIQPEYVAKKAVEGIRRNQDCVCIPHSIVTFAFLLKALPSKIFRAAKKLMGVYVEPRPT